jgi:hypothetical protein
MIALAIGLIATGCLIIFMVTDIPRCWRCNTALGVVARRRQNTMYADYESNFVVLCRPCYEENEADWAERWADYRAMTGY